MATQNTYEKLYDNMKQRFTVINGSDECTLGEYMLLKADQKKEDANLPVIQRSNASSGERAVAMLVSYVNDKLTIKAPPVKDKTLRAFPFRTSASAFLSAAVACCFLLTFSVIGASVLASAVPSDEGVVAENVSDAETEENVPYYN